MTPERWTQIEELFHRAAECPPQRRAALLDQACLQDLDLRREVETLLSSLQSAGDHVQATVRAGLDDLGYPLQGRTISHYRILRGVGGGGMGLVYEAEDIKLGRRVALKFLPEESSRNPEVLRRFEREARAASALEHPNICPIYEFGEHDGQPFLVMQLLDGQTLQALISAAGPEKPPLELGGLLDLAIQIAEGLEAAHRQGIIHRDIKPANIFVTSRGQAKILDFGLAKLAQPAKSAGQDLAGDPDDSKRAPHEPKSAAAHGLSLSRTGVAMGTAGYMSPEQVRGEKLDPRTDLFSFGSVLYEMATGMRAFVGDTGPVLNEAILNQTPRPVRTLNPEIPARLDNLINKALEKDRELRYLSASEMRDDLKALKQETDLVSAGVYPKRNRGDEDLTQAPRVRRGRWQRGRLPWVLAATVVSGLLILTATTTLLRAPKPHPALHSALILPPGFRLDPENTSLALSPDGHLLALAAAGPDGKQRLWLRSMGDLGIKPLAGTEGATYPFWSPDGRYLGFFADQKLKKLEISSGAVQALCDATNGRGATWNREGMIAFAPSSLGALYEISASGGTPIQLTSAKSGTSDRLPHFLPDGKRLLFFSSSNGRKGNGIYELDLETGKVELVAKEESEGFYVQPGFLVFVRGHNLMAQRFDAQRLRTSGQAVPIAEKVLFYDGRWTGAYSFSESGLLVFQAGSAVLKSRLTWFGTDGENLGILGEPADFTFVSISPDGNRVLTEVMGGDGHANLWMYNLGSGSGVQFSFGTGSYRDPVWSPDAKSVVYDDRANMNPDYLGPDATDEYSLYRKDSDGTAEVRISNAGGIANSWSPDGQSLVFMAASVGTAMWVLPMTGPGKPYPFVVTPPGDIRGYWKRGSFSPDGHWFSYLSDETGKYELFVAPFPGPGGKWQISSGGADAPQWLGGRGELVYINGEHKLVAVGIKTKANEIQIGKAYVLFGGRPLPGLPCGPSTYGSPVYLTTDGKRILLPVPSQENASLSLVTNWMAEFKN